MSPLRWTCKSTTKLAAELSRKGYPISARTVARLLEKDLDYSLQANRKTREGASHPDRNAQFEYIAEQTRMFQQRGQPVISVDTNSRLADGLQLDQILLAELEATALPWEGHDPLKHKSSQLYRYLENDNLAQASGRRLIP